jgi:hypothetical protein
MSTISRKSTSLWWAFIQWFVGLLSMNVSIRGIFILRTFVGNAGEKSSLGRDLFFPVNINTAEVLGPENIKGLNLTGVIYMTVQV